MMKRDERRNLEGRAPLKPGEGGEGTRGEMDSQTPSAHVHVHLQIIIIF